MKNNRTYRELPIEPRTTAIVNGAEMRALKDYFAEFAAVALDATAEEPEVDFDSYRPRLDALGLSVTARVERMTEVAPTAGQFALEAAEEGAVVLQFPGAAARGNS